MGRRSVHSSEMGPQRSLIAGLSRILLLSYDWLGHPSDEQGNLAKDELPLDTLLWEESPDQEESI